MKEKKTSLLEKISSIENLKEAWNKLDKTNKESHGLSGETIEIFEKNKEDKLASISEKLKTGKFKFHQTRGVLISKKDRKSFRPLQIPEISDRVVIKAIAIQLDEIFENTLKKSRVYSFAYQKDIGVKDALLKIKEHYIAGNNFILEADLINFFGTVNKNDLLKDQIFPFLPDSSINKLILDALNQKIGNLTEFEADKVIFFNGIENGIPQGNALSPLLSNIYLSEFDQKLIKDKFCLVRYADDFVILARTEEECKFAYKKSIEYLKELKLELHPLEEGIKTKITNIENETVTFLSVTFDGKDLYPSIDNFIKFKEKIWELLKGKIDLNLMDFLTKIKNRHDGWISAFIFTDLKRYSEELDYTINQVIYKKLEIIDWKIKTNKLDILPKSFRSKKSSNYCITDKQRENSGIPRTNYLIDEKIKRIAIDNEKTNI